MLKNIRYAILFLTIFLISCSKKPKSIDDMTDIITNENKKVNEDTDKNDYDTIKDDYYIEPSNDIKIEEDKSVVNDENIDEEVINRYSPDISEVYIEVYKKLRKLILYKGDEKIGEYKIGLGFTPKGHKKREGDGKTPEGEYYVCVRNPNSSFYLSLGLSYPNIDDARKGLEDEVISTEEFEDIKRAINNKTIPNWYTQLGGEIMIHGHGSHRDWTAGCVAVDNEIMDVLWSYCEEGVKVFIYQ